MVNPQDVGKTNTRNKNPDLACSVGGLEQRHVKHIFFTPPGLFVPENSARSIHFMKRAHTGFIFNDGRSDSITEKHT